MLDEVRPNLWNDGAGAGKQVTFDEALLEQYKLYVEMADRVSQRRGTANAFFLSVNSLAAVVVGTLWADPPEASTWFLIFPLIILEGVCVAWFWIVRSYRQLNAGKWMVVGALEERLPASPWWRAEWIALGQGEDQSKYWPLTHLEQWIPCLFAVTYAAAFVVSLVA